MLWGWGSLTGATFLAIVFAPIDESQREALLGLHRTVSYIGGPVVVGLFGLDATGAQIIPAWKGDDNA